MYKVVFGRKGSDVGVKEGEGGGWGSSLDKGFRCDLKSPLPLVVPSSRVTLTAELRSGSTWVME